MDKESIVAGLIATAGIGFAFYGILHELQPVLLAAVNFIGIVLIILTLAACFAALFTLITIVTDRPYMGNPTAGTLIAIEFMRQRRIKISLLSLTQKTTGYENITTDYQQPYIDGRDYYHYE